MLTDLRQSEIIENCRILVREKSYSGKEASVAEAIKAMMARYGFDEIAVDRYGNVVGGIVGRLPGRTILFDGHIDTVPVDEASWTRQPWGAEVADGRIYGRGTSDMKGAVAAMISACGFFAQDHKRDFAGKIYISCVVHEECFEGVAARLVSAKYRPDYVVIGEASELNLKIGQRGRAEIVVETFGKPAHSANPDAGINAVYKMARLIDAIHALKPPCDRVLGRGILELTDIKSAPYPGASVVPEYCRATYDRRLLVGESPASVLEPLQRIIEDLAKTDPDFKAAVSFAHGRETCYTGTLIESDRFFPGWAYDEGDEFVRLALAGLRSAGIDPAITQYSFCTNASHYAGEAGIRTVGFGPSRETLAHVIDEYIEIPQLVGAAQGYYGMMRSVCSGL
ncbi:Acetylornithine deacetylase (plasmid) [Rhodovastum atsumiense]|uniref:YgeY family selenium metabolism-linked hydrolase n=1 Tax=Rhodovastum atsumiense TaxID=504468 RepID=A0A5M6IJK3_9PROT|nr:YgeY family selenium metabolism-linked hydrolase [Rhodovastum atsumiense]KAA5608009.1 YgeY family selenium metabolism-linked hydrolase [Rhodovastum atsumiense]CAH2605656.1 Acetylornithine deacetylase [Rhodovastum atsumiense]